MQQRLVTLKRASELSGIPYRQILLACNAGEIPHYKIRKSRRMVLVSEIMEILRVDHQEGGRHEW